MGMRALFFLLLLTSCTSGLSAKPIAVIGDSVTSDPQSWANIIVASNQQQLYISAQPGRSIINYQLPRDLSAYSPHYSEIIYFLGSVDILERVSRFKSTLFLRQHLSFLQERSFRVLVILPPVFIQRKIGSEAFRAMMIAVCIEKGISYADSNEVWEYTNTVDGVHPTTYGHQVLAEFITKELNIWHSQYIK
jgi:hypothetical protein